MDYTANFGMKLPKRGVDMVKVDDLNDNTEDIDTLIHQNRTMIAPAFDSTKAYVVGDPVVYLGELFVFIAPKAAGAWDATKVEPTTAAEMGGGGASALADLDDVEITSPTDGQALLYDDSDDTWKNSTLPDPSVVKEVTGNPVEFTDGADAPLVKCVTKITGYQEGTGTPSPDNIRPIVAYNQSTISVGGRNVISTDTLTYNVAYSGYQFFDFPNKKPNTEYTIAFISDKAFDCKGLWTTTPNEIYSISVGQNIIKYKTENDLRNKYKMFFETGTAPGSVNFTNCFIAESYIQDADYHYVPYESTTHTATFSTSIYQGNADFVGGKARATWGYIASYNGETLSGEWISSMDEYAPGTTPTTGAQVAYELASPTEETITPTNLPMKSLSGYNHIESSTGDMVVDYIRDTYQPIVDLIQSSAHVYSTAEQVVGKWTDGKPIYEITYILTTEVTLTANQWNSITGVSLSGVETPISAEIRGSRGTSVANVDFFDRPISMWGTSGTEKVKSITLRYTKSTSNRSLSVPESLQKAQIEPLEEKGEETPVEEEKAVETPVETEEENEEER